MAIQARARTGGGRVRSRSTADLAKYVVFHGLVLPAVLLRGVYTIGPLVYTIIMSFTNKSIVREGDFIGLRNFVRMVTDPHVHETLNFTGL